MPKIVVENKIKGYLTAAITCMVLCLIPIGLVALFNIGNAGVWSAPYPKYLLYFLIIQTVFALGIGYVGQLNKLLYMIIGGITVVGTLVIVVMGYAMANPILMHLGAASLFLLMSYLLGNYGGNGYFFRYSAPILVILIGLINILWFVGVGVSITVHIIITTIYNLIFGIISFFRIKDEIKWGFSFIESKDFSYREETEEEIRERKEAKRQAKEERLARRSTLISNQLAITSEQRNKYVEKYGAGAKWLIKRSQIQTMFEAAEAKANQIIEELNYYTDYNNTQIRISTDPDHVAECAKNNKLIQKEYKRLKRTLNEVNSRIKTLANREFTIDDCGKNFTYRMLKNKWEVQNYDGDEPLHVDVIGFTRPFFYCDDNGPIFKTFTYDMYFLERIDK